MTGPQLEFHPQALQEAENAVAWYAERSMRAAERFVEEVEVAVAAIGRPRNGGPDSTVKPGACFFADTRTS